MDKDDIPGAMHHLKDLAYVMETLQGSLEELIAHGDLQGLVYMAAQLEGLWALGP